MKRRGDDLAINVSGKRDGSMGGYVDKFKHKRSVSEKSNTSHDCAVSFSNIILSKLYHEGFMAFNRGAIKESDLVVLCHRSFDSLLTVNDAVVYEVEEVIRYSLRMRFLYLPLRSVKLFVREGLERFFRGQNIKPLCDNCNADYELVISRCIAVTMCSALDKTCMSKVHKHVIDYILNDLCKAQDGSIYEYRWIIHKSCISEYRESDSINNNKNPGSDTSTFWEPLSEIWFYESETKNINRMRANVLNMQVCGRAVDNYLQIRSRDGKFDIKRLQHSKHLMKRDGIVPNPIDADTICSSVHEFDEDKAWLISRNPQLYKSSVGEYHNTPKEFADSVNWMINHGHGPHFRS